MLKAVKLLRKLFVTLLFVFSSIGLATGIYFYQYRDQIIQKFLEEAKKQSKNPIQIGTIQLTAIKTFPHIGLVMQDVVVKDCTKAADDLMTVREVRCAFDVWQLFHGQYQISHLSLAHGKLYWGEGQSYQLVWNQDKQATQQHSPLVIDLDKVELRDMTITYSAQHDRYTVNALQMQARLRWEYDGLEAHLQGQATICGIELGELAFAQDLPVAMHATIRYDQLKKTWRLLPAQIGYGDSKLTVQGSWGASHEYSAFQIQGEQVSTHLLVRCLPISYYQYVTPYDPRGQLSLKLDINKMRGGKWGLQGNFSLKKGSLLPGAVTKPLTFDQLKGVVQVPQLQDLSTATLSIQEVKSTLSQSQLTGHGVLSNFLDPQLQCAIKGTVDLVSLNLLLPNTVITDAAGKLEFHGHLTTQLRKWKPGLAIDDSLHLTGALQARDVQFKLHSGQLLCKEFTGHVILQDNDWNFRDVAGSLGAGSFVVNGNIRNVLPYLFSKEQQFYADAKLSMDYLDLDALLGGEVNGGQQTVFNIAPRWSMNLACDIQQLHFRRFQGKNVRGQIKVQDQQLKTDKLQLGVAEGNVSLGGILDAREEYLKVHTNARLQGVQVSKLFYMFENFHQDFLTDKHLSGEVFSNFVLTMQANKYWAINKETVQAAIDVRLHHGALHHFEPVQQLNKYVDSDSLTKLRFSALKNHIRIENQTIHIPPMEVHSNITTIQVSGTHTFSGQVAYNFVVPLTGLQQQGRSGMPEEIGEDSLGGINLFLQLQGDVNNYKLTYDTAALKNSLKEELQKQGTVIQRLFQGEYEEKPQLKELSPDDHFEFD